MSGSTATKVQPRIKSSFIYLANAVNDLRANWAALAIVIAPLVLVAAVCLLPDALNLQHSLAQHFTPGARHVLLDVQEPFSPAVDEAKPLVPRWALNLLHLLVVAITLAVNLVVLCSLRRLRARRREARMLDEALATWREAAVLAPSFYWIAILQLALPTLALFIWRLDISTSSAFAALVIFLAEVILLVMAALVFLWLYFAEYALVLDDKHGFHALLFSRDLMRKRFFRVALRIMVFIAVWSGFDSWAAGSFVAVSWILGPVGVITGYFWSVFFLVELIAVTVTYLMVAFFVTAGLRLYQDLTGTPAPASVAITAAMPVSAPVSALNA